MSSERETIHYEYPKGVLLEDLQEQVAAALRDYETNQAIQKEFAAKTGHKPEDVRKELDEAKKEDKEPIELKQEKAGVGVVETLLIAAATQVARDLWKEVILPWIRKKYGPKVLKEKQ